MDLSDKQLEAIADMDADALQKWCSDQTWFHAIDFGSFQSSGRFQPGTPQNATLYPAFDVLNSMDLRGADCLDVGASDGILSFGMAALGAKSVTAADSFRLPTFLAARKLLAANVSYHPGLQIKDLISKFGEKSFDVICCCGVIYHMLNPMSAFVVARKLLREGGILIMETAYASQLDDAVMVMNTESQAPLKELYTYWVPSKRAVVGMMKLVGFDIVSVQPLHPMSRLTVVGQAVKPGEVQDRQEILEKVHGVDLCDFEFRFKDIDGLGQRTASVSRPKLPAERTIVPATHEVDWPYHPKTMSNPVGRTRWVSSDGNYA